MFIFYFFIHYYQLFYFIVFYCVEQNDSAYVGADEAIVWCGMSHTILVINTEPNGKECVTTLTLEAGQQRILGRRSIPSPFCSRIQAVLSAEPTGVYITPAQNNESRKQQCFSDGRLLQGGQRQPLKSGDMFTVFYAPHKSVKTRCDIRLIEHTSLTSLKKRKVDEQLLEAKRLKRDAENAKQQAQQLMAEVRDTEYRQQMRLTVLKRREATVRKDELDATRLANLDEFDNTDWSTSLPEEDCEEILAGLSSLDQSTDSEQRYNLRSKGKSNTLPKTNKATQKQDKQKEKQSRTTFGSTGRDEYLQKLISQEFALQSKITGHNCFLGE